MPKGSRTPGTPQYVQEQLKRITDEIESYAFGLEGVSIARLREAPGAVTSADTIDRAASAIHRFAAELRDSRTCPVCGNPVGGRADARYCSTRCRVTASRQRPAK
jgi:hypothetical protein